MPIGFTGVNMVQPFAYNEAVGSLNRSKAETRPTTTAAKTAVNNAMPGNYPMFAPGVFVRSLRLQRSKRYVPQAPNIPLNNSRRRNKAQINELYGSNINLQNHQTRRASRRNNPLSGFFSGHKKGESLTPNSAHIKAQKSHSKQVNPNIPLLGLPVYKFINTKPTKTKKNPRS